MAYRIVKDFGARLSADAPDVFNLTVPVPLKLGIGYDIAQRYADTPWWVRHNFLNWWLARRAYLAACQPGAARHGFTGVDGKVTAREAKWAVAALRKRPSVPA